MKQVCSTSILTKVYVCSSVYTELNILAPDCCTFNLVIQICHWLHHVVYFVMQGNVLPLSDAKEYTTLLNKQNYNQ